LGEDYSIANLATLITNIKAGGHIHDSTEYTHVILYIAQSYGVILHLLSGSRDIMAMCLKGSMTDLESTVEIGHLNGIRGMIYQSLYHDYRPGQEIDGVPFLDKAIEATNRHFEYVYAKAKTLSIIRHFHVKQGTHWNDLSKVHVSEEEIKLFAEVSTMHKFAVPHLLFSLATAINNKRYRDDECVSELQRHHTETLEEAWNQDHDCSGVPGLTRLAKQFEFTKQISRAREIYQEALEREPIKTNDTLLHQYGNFLIRHGGPEKIKTGFEYLIKAGHPNSFTSFLQLFEDNPTFEGKESMIEYLEQFISCNKKVSYQRLFTYIAYRYLVSHGDALKGIEFLIGFDLADLTFEFNPHFKKWTWSYKYIQAVMGTGFLPKNVDLSYDVAFILDPIQHFDQQIVKEFRSWWATSGLHAVDQYAGYKAYQKHQKQRRTRNSDTDRPSSSRRSNN